MGLIFMGNMRNIMENNGFGENKDSGENKGFLYIMAREGNYEAFPWYVSHGFWKEKRKTQYLKKKLPVETEAWEILGQEGLRVRLPFTFEQLKRMEEAVLRGFLERIGRQ